MTEIKKLEIEPIVNPFKGMTQEEIQERENYINNVLKNEERIKCQKRFEACGIGVEHKDYRMDNFVVTNKTQENMKRNAKKFYVNVHDKKVISNLVLLGNAGQGKTRLAISLLHIFNELVKNSNYGLNDYYTVSYTTSKDICNTLQQYTGFNASTKYNNVLKEYAYADIMAIDEIGKATNKHEYELIFDLLDKRLAMGKSTILISNQSYDDFTNSVGEYAMSRINTDGNMILIDTSDLPDYRQNKDLLKVV